MRNRNYAHIKCTSTAHSPAHSPAHRPAHQPHIERTSTAHQPHIKTLPEPRPQIVEKQGPESVRAAVRTSTAHQAAHKICSSTSIGWISSSRRALTAARKQHIHSNASGTHPAFQPCITSVSTSCYRNGARTRLELPECSRYAARMQPHMGRT